MVVKAYPQNTEIETTGNSSNAWGIPIPALAGAFGGSAPTNAHTGLRLPLFALMLTTSTVERKGKTGRITALQALNDYGGKNACILLCVACDTLVPIRTGLGTRLLLLGSAQTMAELWNLSGVELGTKKN